VRLFLFSNPGQGTQQNIRLAKTKQPATMGVYLLMLKKSLKNKYKICKFPE
jgi:hypothetical protein